MEETVMTEVGFAAEASAPGDAGREINAAELLGEEQQQSPEETVIENGGDGQQTETIPNREEQEKAERNRVFAGMERSARAKVRKEFETNPAYIFGTKMLNYLMTSKGISFEDAAKFADGQLLQAIAQQENASPAVAKMLYDRMTQGQDNGRDEKNAFDGKKEAEMVREELGRSNLPEGFDFDTEAGNEEFAQMLIMARRNPTEMAIRAYHAERQAKNAPAEVAEKLKARMTIPQSMKTQQPVTPKIDFDNMSDEEFDRFEERVKQERLRGNRIIF